MGRMLGVLAHGAVKSVSGANVLSVAGVNRMAPYALALAQTEPNNNPFITTAGGINGNAAAFKVDYIQGATGNGLDCVAGAVASHLSFDFETRGRSLRGIL